MGVKWHRAQDTHRTFTAHTKNIVNEIVRQIHWHTQKRSVTACKKETVKRKAADDEPSQSHKHTSFRGGLIQQESNSVRVEDVQHLLQKSFHSLFVYSSRFLSKARQSLCIKLNYFFHFSHSFIFIFSSLIFFTEFSSDIFFPCEENSNKKLNSKALSPLFLLFNFYQSENSNIFLAFLSFICLNSSLTFASSPPHTLSSGGLVARSMKIFEFNIFSSTFINFPFS